MKSSSSIFSISRNSVNKRNGLCRSMLMNIIVCLLNYQVTDGYIINNLIFKNRNAFITHGIHFETSNQKLDQQKYQNLQKPLLASKYDLGIGKNQPLDSTKKPNLKNGGKVSNDNNSNDHHSHDFLIEHESVNRYPSPFDNERRIKAYIEENNDNRYKQEGIIENHLAVSDQQQQHQHEQQQQHQQQKQKKISNDGYKKDLKKKMKRTIIRPRPNRLSEDFLTIVDSPLQHHDDNTNINNNISNDVTFLPKAYARKRKSASTMTLLDEAIVTTTSPPSKQPIKQQPVERFNVNTVWVEMLIHAEQRQIQLGKA